MLKMFVEMQTMTYNPPTAQVTAQKDVTHGSVQPTTKTSKKKMEKSDKKTEIIINPSKKDIQEKSIPSFSDYIKLGESDYWHPDPEKDRKLSNRGAKLRAREDSESKPKSKDNSKSLRPGESYMDYAKRHGYKSPENKKIGLRDKLKQKLGLKNSFEHEGEVIESYVPGKPAEKVGALTNIDIPQSEREAAKARLLAKTAAKRKEREMAKEEVGIEEGMSLKDYKKKRSAIKQKEKRASDKIAPNRRKDIHTDRYSPERAARHRANVDPDFEGNDERNYPGGKLKNPKKIRKAKALGELGEMLTFSQFMEARRMDKEGVDRGDSKRAERVEKAKASLAAVKKGEERKIKVSKKYGIEPSKADTVEKKSHKRDFPGSRQAPKVKGAKETASETQNRRARRHNERVLKHGFTSKEKRDNAAMAKHTSRFD